MEFVFFGWNLQGKQQQGCEMVNEQAVGAMCLLFDPLIIER